MIKLGALTAQAINKEFPNNWKSLAVMLKIDYAEYFDSDDDDDKNTTSIELEFDDNSVVTINSDNTIQTTTPVTNEVLAEIIIQQSQNRTKP